MSLPQERTYTIEDIYNLPEGTRAELIDGQIYMMAPPKRIHQRISGWLHATIYNHINSHDGNCEVYSAPFAVFLYGDDTTYVEPDISVICDKDKLNDDGCKGAPDWIIEIISPSTASYDYIRKLNLYQLAGVREYWIVNPQSQTVYVYYFEKESFKTSSYAFQDKIKVNIYDDLVIDFSHMEM